MKERRSRASKVHFQHNGNHRTLCGLDGRTTYMVNAMTCRVCMFHYLAESASWARAFLDDLRGRPAVRPRGRDRMTTLMPLTDEQRERIRAEMRRVVGPAALGEFGPLTPEQEADLTRYVDHVRGSLGELARACQSNPVAVPARTATEVDSQEKGLGDGFARAFRYQGSAKGTIGPFLSPLPANLGPVQPVMERRGAPADAIGVKEGQVAEQPGDAGEVGYEPRRYFKAP